MNQKLILENISKVFNEGEFNEVTALSEIDMEFQAGEYVLIIGENGSGKSTLLNVIDGRVERTTGNVYIDGVNINGLKTYQRAKKFFYRLFQDSMHGILPLGTIKENMACAKNRHLPWKWCKPLVNPGEEKVFETVISEFRPELSDKLNKKVFTLSPGERQALVLSLLKLQTSLEPQILLADEPTASLDPHLAQKCIETIEVYANSGWLCLVVTHDTNVIQNHQGRIIQLNGGIVSKDTNKKMEQGKCI